MYSVFSFSGKIVRGEKCRGGQDKWGWGERSIAIEEEIDLFRLFSLL